VQPYHVASVDGQWYLFANDLDREDIRTFVLSRINRISQPGKRFDRPADFSLRDRLLRSFGVFSGEGDYVVKIEFDAFAARLVRERTWHASQQLRELSNERLLMTLQLDSLEEIERWIFSWGSHARVKEPVALRERIQETLAAMQDQYRELPPWYADLHEAAHFEQPERLLQLVMALDRRPDAPGQMHLFRSQQ
jgi:proteasome accessory factor B